jgi:predicted nucleic acid-binding protein
MSNERLLLDATFIAGYLNARDQHHLQAQKCMARVEGAREVIITEAVLIEVGNLLHATQHRRRAAQFIKACYETGNITVVPVTSELLKRALEFLRAAHFASRLLILLGFGGLCTKIKKASPILTVKMEFLCK